MKRRKHWLTLAAATVMSVLMSTSVMAEDTTKIELWYHSSSDQAAILLEMIDKFQEENPDIKVETQSVAFSELKKQITIGAAADELPDITLCDPVDNASFAAMGASKDITEDLEAWGEMDQFYEGPKSSVMYEDRYYGIPYSTSLLAIMYNKDIFDEMGIEYPTADWTWDDFKETVEKTTTEEHYGLTMSLVKSEEGAFNVIPFIWQAGADYDSMDSKGAIEAMNLINDFYQNDYMSKELISMTQADMCASLFATGKSAMMVAGNWLTANIQNENPDLNYGTVTFPIKENSASAIGGVNITLLKDDNRDASLKLMEYLCSKDVNRELCEKAGYISPRMDSVKESEFWASDEIMSVYLEQMESARMRGPHERWPEISSAIQTCYQSILAGEAGVEDACATAAGSIADIIG